MPLHQGPPPDQVQRQHEQEFSSRAEWEQANQPRPGSRRAQREGWSPDTWDGAGVADPAARARMTPPNYNPNVDVEVIWRGLTDSQRRALQARLVQAGMLTGSYRSGILDAPTRSALGGLLQQANGTGESWEQALSSVLASPEVRDPEEDRQAPFQRRPFMGQTYRIPSMEQLAQDVKALFRQEHGIDPTDAEIERFAAALRGADREAFDLNMQAARQEHEAGEDVAAQLHAGATRPGAPGLADVADVDPIARFREQFERETAGIRTAVQEREHSAQGGQLFQANVGVFDRLIGRG